jgi:hypothetical protein
MMPVSWTFAPGRGDIILLQNFHHRGAGHAREDGGEAEAEREGRQHVAAPALHFRNGEPGEFHGEEEHNKRARRFALCLFSQAELQDAKSLPG